MAGSLLEAGLIAGFQHTHTTEFIHCEDFAIKAVALLAKQNGAWAGQSYGQGNQQQHGGDQQHACTGEQ